MDFTEFSRMMEEQLPTRRRAMELGQREWESNKNSYRRQLEKSLNEDPNVPLNQKPGTVGGQKRLLNAEDNLKTGLFAKNYENILANRQAQKERDTEELRRMAMARARDEEEERKRALAKSRAEMNQMSQGGGTQYY